MLSTQSAVGISDDLLGWQWLLQSVCLPDYYQLPEKTYQQLRLTITGNLIACALIWPPFGVCGRRTDAGKSRHIETEPKVYINFVHRLAHCNFHRGNQIG